MAECDGQMDVYEVLADIERERTEKLANTPSMIDLRKQLIKKAADDRMQMRPGTYVPYIHHELDDMARSSNQSERNTPNGMIVSGDFADIQDLSIRPLWNRLSSP